MNEKEIIENWQQKIRAAFGEKEKLYEYLFQTMDNFYYRYIETSLAQNLKTQQIGEHLWGAVSEESSMVDALKLQNPIAKKGIIDLAKFTPREKGPKVRYMIAADVKKLLPEAGSIDFIAEINWGFPDFNDESKIQRKVVNFKYADIAEYRKELALRLEEVSEIFL